MITNALPDIPRLYTAICEWLACMVYVAAIYRRIPLHRTFITAAIGLMAMIGIQYAAGSMPISLWIFGMLMAFGGMFVLIVLSTGCGKREGLYISARAFVLGELVASLHWQLVTFTGTNQLPLNHPWLSASILVGTYGACFALAYLTERSNFSSTEATETTVSLTTSTVIITIVTFAMSNLSFVTTNTPFSSRMGYEVFYIRTLVDLCGFALLYAQQEQARRLEANAELVSIEAHLASQHQEYLQSKDNIEAIRRMAHDLKHQIMALRAELDPEQKAQGFADLEASVQRYSAQNHTGNPVLDVILTAKSRSCADKGITLTAVADGSLLKSMSSMDIATLFGNALDNAIEATEKLPDPAQRQIKLALYQQQHFIVIRVENFFDSKLRKDGAGNLRTTKRNDTRSHGFGVKSIRHIVRQYDGEVNVKTDNHWFVLTMLIPVH
ncbi:sensor histidine kinase [Bifidobacterium tsurumiense]|uniref:Two-component sensor histidine kinase n=1 Tax=Bifidobacterium tsurumiense TaxID=356829 RepID=A0A087E9J3_9BIFI|nr:sensor histidine kinase [Bifidobacterium tsurumiense]KFJ04444.1 two-component sensor histidine kinase [Bifidobacterium tsurumiense]MDY4678488.1 GHKL domain-containing protein [Bifidobacterium tsurumiense]